MSLQEENLSLDYQDVRQEKIRFLQNHELAVLATANGKRVTARTVSYVSNGLDIFFLSWEHHTKCVQIKSNPRVALCIDTLQIEGMAAMLGKPLDDENREYAAIYRSRLPRVFNDFAPRPGMVIVKVVPTLMVTWIRDNDRRRLEHLDLQNEKAYIFEEL